MNFRREIMTTKLTTIIIVLLALTTNSYSADKKSNSCSVKFSSVTENTASCSLEGTGDIVVAIRCGKAESKVPEAGEKFPTFRKNFSVPNVDADQSVLFKAVASKSQQFDLEALVPETKYTIDVYSVVKDKKQKTEEINLLGNYSFMTLAEEPTAQAGYIGFASATENSISMNFVHGNGKNRVVLVRLGKVPAMPQDGSRLAASEIFGIDSARLGDDTYCIYNGNSTGKKPITVTNLQSGKYFFLVLEYNGNGESANYLTKTAQSNPRQKRTALPAPKLLPPTNISATGCEVAWSEVGDAETYIAELATDEKFSKLVDVYNGVDVGKTTSFELSDLPAGITYYFRVRALAEDSKSEFSNVVNFTLK